MRYGKAGQASAVKIIGIIGWNIGEPDSTSRVIDRDICTANNC